MTPPSPSAFVLYFDIAQGPAVIGMSPRWIRGEIQKGLPHLRTAGKILLDPIKVREWMERNYTPPPVDLAEAHRIAAELTSPHQQKGRAG